MEVPVAMSETKPFAALEPRPMIEAISVTFAAHGINSIIENNSQFKDNKNTYNYVSSKDYVSNSTKHTGFTNSIDTAKGNLESHKIQNYVNYLENNKFLLNLKYLRKNDFEFIKSYCENVGVADADSQLKYLQSVDAQVVELFNQAKEEQEIYCKLYIKLGFLIGLIILVVIL